MAALYRPAMGRNDRRTVIAEAIGPGQPRTVETVYAFAVW
jgi:hypothetical protein